MDAIGITGYDFDETFKTCASEVPGRQSVKLPVPDDMITDEEYALRLRAYLPHESLKEELYNERTNLHNFLLK